MFGGRPGVSAGANRSAAGRDRRLGAPPRECEAWVEAFEFLQTLRLRVQSAEAVEPALANTVDVARLNDIDRRILKESLLVVRALQRRVALDWLR